MTHPLNMFEGNMLDPVVKKQFVAALRSGEYPQGQAALNINGCFCCLGVLTDLAVKAGIIEWTDYPRARSARKGVLIDNKVETCILSPQVAKWAGSETLLGDVRFGNGPDDTLMSLNDDLGYTFSQIADIVEERL